MEKVIENLEKVNLPNDILGMIAVYVGYYDFIEIYKIHGYGSIKYYQEDSPVWKLLYNHYLSTECQDESLSYFDHFPLTSGKDSLFIYAIRYNYEILAKNTINFINNKYLIDYALIKACENNNLKIVKLLLKNNARVNISDYHVLRYACVHNYYDIAKIILEKDPFVGIITLKEYQLIKQNNYENIINLLNKYNYKGYCVHSYPIPSCHDEHEAIQYFPTRLYLIY